MLIVRGLTNGQWARLEAVLPPVRMGRPPRDRRVVIDAIRWRVRTESPWRDMPERYGPWETMYGLFRQWQRDGVWQDLLTRLQAQADAEQIITWDVSVDSTVCRAHQHAAGARKRATIRNIRRAEWTPNPTTTPSAERAAGQPTVRGRVGEIWVRGLVAARPEPAQASGALPRHRPHRGHRRVAPLTY